MIISDSKEEPASAVIDRLHPAIATIKERYLLTKAGSTKHTFHVSLDLSRAPIQFKVGDSIGIYAQNDPHLVSHLIEAMKAKKEDQIIEPRSGKPMALWEFLSYKANLSRLTSSFLKLFYDCEKEHDKKNCLHRLLQTENKPLLSQYLSTHDPLDLLKEYQDVETPLQDLCAQFGPLLPRFYSVASSQLLLKDEVHLTVALFTFSHQGEQRYGVGSHFLCHLAKVKETQVPIYVQPAHYFTLPADDNASIIMIGPGTGVAPYRAFMQERIAKGANGKNWLFFGERNRHSDYFYEPEWEQWISQGKLKLDLAFSRDQHEKIYVQHKMLEKAKELWAWLEDGAYFYVCGDAHRMAKDVETMLQRIVQEQGQMSEEAAKNYVKTLRTQKRYLADVY
jgi:sulfite reductase (NADPH) flavoprotein alpha-component